jgi:hypothetical protein
MAMLQKALKKTPIKNLKLAKFNPASRQADIKSLIASIEKVGLLVPITVTKQLEVADGHRRIAAYKKLGWTDIPAIVAEGTLAELFSEINGSVKRLTGEQTLEVYLKEPEAVGVKVRNQLKELEQVAGRTMLVRMHKGKFALGTWQAAKRIVAEAEIDDEDFTVQTLKWIMKYRCARNVRRALQLGTAPSKIVAAVKNDKPLRITYTA